MQPVAATLLLAVQQPVAKFKRPVNSYTDHKLYKAIKAIQTADNFGKHSAALGSAISSPN